jgi:hypothetical protein
VPRSRLHLAVALSVGCAVAAACGSAAGPPAVDVSLTAPVDGATVVVPGITVLGTIEPKTAVVTVAGKRAHVAGGLFMRVMFLRRKQTLIKIVVSAPGYTRFTTVVSVSYQPIKRASRANVMRRATHKHSMPPSVRTKVPNTGGGGLPPGTKSAFIASCSRTGGSVAGCFCVWSELQKRGFDSERQWEDLAMQWRRSFPSSGMIAFPPTVKSAIVSCAAEFRAAY